MNGQGIEREPGRKLSGRVDGVGKRGIQKRGRGESKIKIELKN